jgi:hypothetical protein
MIANKINSELLARTNKKRSKKSGGCTVQSRLGSTASSAYFNSLLSSCPLACNLCSLNQSKDSPSLFLDCESCPDFGFRDFWTTLRSVVLVVFVVFNSPFRFERVNDPKISPVRDNGHCPDVAFGAGENLDAGWKRLTWLPGSDVLRTG